MQEPHLPKKKVGLHVDVTQSHPLHWMCFSQYQASSVTEAAISCTECSQVAGLHAVGRNVSNAASHHVAVHCSYVQLYACEGVWGEEEYIVYMCGSPRIEIKYYSIVYFEHITKFDTL